MLKLIIGNKAYSSWSLRGWLACKQSGLAVRGGRGAALRQRLGQAPRGRRVRAVLGQGADPVGRRRGGLGQPGDHRISRREDRAGEILARGRCRARDGAIDGGGDAFELHRAPPQAQHERPPGVPAPAARRGCARRSRANHGALGAGTRAFRRDGQVPVRRVRRGRHHVRPGRHADRHLSACRSRASRRAIWTRCCSIPSCRTGSPARRKRNG